MHTLIKAGVRLVIIFVSLILLIFFANNIANIVGFSHFGSGFELFPGLAVIIGVALICALILFILWRKTDWLVTKLAGDISENEIVINTSNLDLINVVMRIIGMVLILISIPKLAGLIAYRGYLATAYQSVGFPSHVTASEWQNWITVIGTILIGIWLVLGGTGIFSFFNRIWKYIENAE